MKKADLFGTCMSPGCIAVFAFLLVASVLPGVYSDIGYVLFFFFLGSLCMWNNRRCGRIHCRYTGPGSLVVGGLALLKVLGVMTISWNAIWLIFIVMIVIGFAIEYKKSGTFCCYRN